MQGFSAVAPQAGDFMKVKELIDKLKVLDQDREVKVKDWLNFPTENFDVADARCDDYIEGEDEWSNYYLISESD